MTKQTRHFAIKEIITSKPITRQNELRRELQKRGFKVTQATLSRDMRDLGVSRVAFGRTARYVLEPAPEARILRPLVGAEILSIDSSENIIVIRTLPACANTVGEFIDVQKHPDIIGTVAGDNTLLVIPRSQKKTNLVVTFLKTKLTEGG
jgi:transcriptional regulator of arginine metabolism